MMGRPRTVAGPVMVALQSAGFAGLSHAELRRIVGRSVQAVNVCLQRLVRTGEVFAVGLPRHQRYFADAALAQAFAQAIETAQAPAPQFAAPKPQQKRAAPQAPVQASAPAVCNPATPWRTAPSVKPARVAQPKASSPAPVTVKAGPKSPQVVVPANVKRTVCPAGQDMRYRLPEGTRVLGGFATMGIGRYVDGAAA